jgi:uncharacterized lipoprotein YmbA
VVRGDPACCLGAVVTAADTIREALGPLAQPVHRAAALAALTELEQQLAEALNLLDGMRTACEGWRVQCVAAEADRDRLGKELTLAIQRNAEVGAALADANLRVDRWVGEAVTNKDRARAAEQRADDYADTLRKIAGNDNVWCGQYARQVARAALDRHTKDTP